MTNIVYQNKKYLVFSEPAVVVKESYDQYSSYNKYLAYKAGTKPRVGIVDNRGRSLEAWKVTLYHIKLLDLDMYVKYNTCHYDNGKLRKKILKESSLDIERDSYGNPIVIGYRVFDETCIPQDKQQIIGDTFFKIEESIEKDKKDVAREKKLANEKSKSEIFDTLFKKTIEDKLLPLGLRIGMTSAKNCIYSIYIDDLSKVIPPGLNYITDEVIKIFNALKIKTVDVKFPLRDRLNQKIGRVEQYATIMDFKVDLESKQMEELHAN